MQLHPMLVQKLSKDPSDENRAKGSLKHSQLKPEWDLWSFGLTILDLFGMNYENGLLEKNSIINE